MLGIPNNFNFILVWCQGIVYSMDEYLKQWPMISSRRLTDQHLQLLSLSISVLTINNIMMIGYRKSSWILSEFGLHTNRWASIVIIDVIIPVQTCPCKQLTERLKQILGWVNQKAAYESLSLDIFYPHILVLFENGMKQITYIICKKGRLELSVFLHFIYFSVSNTKTTTIFIRETKFKCHCARMLVEKIFLRGIADVCHRVRKIQIVTTTWVFLTIP